MTARPPPWVFRGQFTYALTLRPASFATVPAGFTELGPPTDDYPHGTVSYERPLRSGDIEHFDLEPLDPDDPMIWKRAFQAYRDEVYRTFSETKGFEQPAAGGRYTLSYSTRPGVTFQVTMWQEDWTPTGHLDINDFGEAVRLLWGAMPREDSQRRLEAALWKRRRGNPLPTTHRALPLSTVLRWRPEAARRGVSSVARGQGGFLPAYEAAGGHLGRMSPWWQARREAFLARHLAQAKAHHEPLLDANGEPTRRHLALIMWAYSPDPALLRKKIGNP